MVEQILKPLFLVVMSLRHVITSFTLTARPEGPLLPEYAVPLIVNVSKTDSVSKATLDNVPVQ